MKRLSFADAIFLYTETPETPMHVGQRHDLQAGDAAG